MHDPLGAEAQRLYAQALERGVREASKRLPWDEAFEVAHDVASAMVRRGTTPPNDADSTRTFDALIRRAVAFRVRDVWRSGARRSAAERVHHDERSGVIEPGIDLEVRELSRIVAACVAEMPVTMREVFLRIRRDGASYKQAADALGIGVGTVHTHFSRATARLRDAVDRYRADDVPRSAANGS
jgi:DNA-directed RNA polymerase specialized sigma24 family protein